MANNVKIIYNNQSYSFPIIEGSENEKAIDIKQLRSKTGFITYDPGYKNTGHCISNITYLDGENGILRYRGYSIDELCKKTTFLEVCYLLIFGELPTKQQLDKFQFDINKESLIDEHVKKIFHSFPKSAHPMGVLSSLTSAMIAFSPDETKLSLKESTKSENDKILYNSTIKLLAKFPILSSWTLRKIKGLPLNYSSDRFNYVENIAYLMFAKPNQEYVQNDIVVNALNSLLILHADHEQNCSTSTVRIVGSSYAGLFASISAGISALCGRLHGGANQAVIEMLKTIKKDNSNYKKYIFSLECADNEGIIHHFTKYLNQKKINIEEMNTSIINAPITGSILFSLKSIIYIPKDLNVNELKSKLNMLSGFMVDTIFLQNQKKERLIGGKVFKKKDLSERQMRL